MSHYDDTCTALAIGLITNTPTILWGDPGQGKSSVLQQIATDQGLHMETVIASIREPADFGGLPVVDQISKTVDRAPDTWAQRLVEHGGGMVFYDEISTAPPAVQAALLRPVLEGYVGDLKLPENTRSVAAANPADIAAGGWELALPLANRFLHLNWSLPADVVRDGFTMGFAPIAIPNPSAESVAKAVAEAKILVGTFVSSHSEMLTVMPDTSEEGNMAYPTPRSWEQVAKLYGAAKAAGCNSNVIQLLVTGSVGTAAAGAFIHFAANLDLPNPETVLADPAAWTVPSERGDKVYATLASVWTAVANSNTEERWTACGRVLSKVADSGHADVAYNFGRRWAQSRPGNAMPDADTTRAMGPVLVELGKIVG